MRTEDATPTIVGVVFRKMMRGPRVARAQPWATISQRFQRLMFFRGSYGVNGDYLRQKLAGFCVGFVTIVEGHIFFERWEFDGNAVGVGFF